MSLLSIDGKRYSWPEFDNERDGYPDGSLLFLSDARGIYIPQHFAESVDFEKTADVKASDWDCIAAGPEHEWYWEAWTAICDNGTVTATDGKVYAIYQDGDCWLIPLEVQS